MVLLRASAIYEIINLRKFPKIDLTFKTFLYPSSNCKFGALKQILTANRSKIRLFCLLTVSLRLCPNNLNKSFESPNFLNSPTKSDTDEISCVIKSSKKNIFFSLSIASKKSSNRSNTLEIWSSMCPIIIFTKEAMKVACVSFICESLFLKIVIFFNDSSKVELSTRRSSETFENLVFS